MPRLMFACFLLGGLIPEPTPTDYCATSYCDAGLTNVGCNPPPLTGGPTCDGKEPLVIGIGQAEIDYILDLLNTLRSEFASGAHDPTFPTASRMPILQWNVELAKQAGNNARYCLLNLDQCHNTAEFSNSGQGFQFFANNDAMNTNQILLESIKNVKAEKNAYAFGSLSYTSYISSNDGTRLLANVLNDRSSKVGCAVQHFKHYDLPGYLLVCNFSDNLVDDEPLYTQGTTGSDCSTISTSYSGLCAA
uniref:SCP domain-containing protein n=1 Tax=Anopheles atroparvus TaxID=41427 RepID=A0AAG5D384_ANOAO